jgi:predicted Zn-dependent peptidase
MKIKKLNKDAKSISVGIFVPTGSAFENENERGLAHFIEHMLFKGTKNRGYKEIAEEIDILGGIINAFTSKEYTGFYVKVLKDFIDSGFDVLRDIISNSLIDESELEKEKNVIIEEINMTEDNPDDAVFEAFMENSIEGSFGKPILGTKEHIKSYKREDLLQFMGKYYKPENIIISAVGKIDKVDFSIDNEFIFKNYFKDNTDNNIGFEFKKGQEIIKRDIQQSNVVLGCNMFNIFDDRKYAAYLLNDIFGGTMSSKLFQTIREEQSLCYHISSSVKLFQKGGLMNVFAGTYKENTQKLLDSIKNELIKLKKSYLTEDELKKAKTHFKGSYMLSLESSYSLMVKQGIDTILYGDYVNENEIIKKVEEVTLDDIVEIVDLMDLDNFHITVLGDVEKIVW